MFKIILAKIKSDPKLYFSISVIMVFVIIVLHGYMIRFDMDKNPDKVLYTIGKIYKYKPHLRVPGSIFFKYTNDKGILKDIDTSIDTLFGRHSSFYNKKFVGNSYLVKFSPEYATYSKLFLNAKVPDSLVNCKDCFWKEKPKWAIQK